MPRFLTTLCLTSLLASLARAEDRTPDGFLVGDPVAVATNTFAFDDLGHMLSVDGLGLYCSGGGASYEFIDQDVNSPEVWRFGFTSRAGGFRPGTPFAYAFSSGYRAAGVQVLPGFAAFRAECGLSATALLELPPDPSGTAAPGVPPEIEPRFRGPVPIGADGLAYLPTVDGLYRMDLEAPAPPAPFLSAAALDAALALADPEPYSGFSGAPADPHPHFVSAAVDDLGRLLAVLGMPITGWGDALWLVAVGPDGSIEVLARPAQLRAAGATQAAPFGYDRTASVLLGLCGANLCVVGTGGLRADRPVGRASGAVGPVGSSQSIVGFIAGTAHPYAVMAAAQGSLRPVTVDAARLDADRDGLTRAKEQALGLSDDDVDVDSDGAADGRERFFGTDPLDAASRPGASAPPTRFAPSNWSMDWSFFRHPNVARGSLATPGSWLGAVCVPTTVIQFGAIADYSCRLADGLPMLPDPFPGVAPAFSPQRTHALIDRERLVELSSGAEVLSGEFGPGAMVLGPDTVLEVGNGGVRRLRPDGAFDVIDLGRTACPLLGSDAEAVPRCADPGEELIDGLYVVPLGYLPSASAWMFAIQTETRGAYLVAVDRERAERVAHSAHYGDAVPYFAATPEGDRLISTWVRPEGRGLATLDSALGVLVPESGRGGWTPSPGPWFRDGFVEYGLYWNLRWPPPASDSGGCNTVGGVTICGFDPALTPTPTLAPTPTLTEWVPVPAALEPGETLAFASTRTVPGGVGETRHDPEWALLRITRTGGTDRWIDAERFRALIAEADRHSFNDKAPVLDLAAHADLRRLCVVQGYPNGYSRLWELSLDSSGAPQGVALLASGAIRACLWRGDEIVRLETSSARGADLVAGATRVSLPDVNNPSDFLALPDGALLVWGETGAAACVRDGTVARARRLVSAADVHDGLVFLLDHLGVPFVSEPAAVCGEGGQEEGLAETVYGTTPISAWAVAARSVGAPFDMQVDRGHLAVRSDGWVLFASERLRPKGTSEAGGLWKDQLYRLRPSFTPRWWDDRLERLDPRRREQARVGPASYFFGGITALTSLPTGLPDEEDDWEWLGGTRPPPYLGEDPPPPPPDAGSAPDAAGSTEAPPGGCACGLGSSALPGAWALLGALSLLARRRRR